jgi:hypothetical protein
VGKLHLFHISSNCLALSTPSLCLLQFDNKTVDRKARKNAIGKTMRTVTGSVTMPMLLLVTPLLADDQHGCTHAHLDHDPPSFRKGT